jgi:hypothetical protein
VPLHPLQLHGDKELASKLPFCKAASVKEHKEVVNINMRSNNIVITISSVSNNGYCELESRLWFKTHSNHLSLDKEIAVKAPGVIEPLFFILIVFLLKQRWKLNTLTATLFLNL